MANQGYEFDTKLDLNDIVNAANVADLLTPKEVGHIANCVKAGYDEDVNSRKQWETRNAQAMELALQVMKMKSFPWTGASNVKFPLITVAALQYQARAYPTLVDASDLVKVKVYGDDPGGKNGDRADRIAEHMTWQNIEQDCEWEEIHDKALLVQAIVGNCFVKKVFNPACARIETQLVEPRNFVVNYFTQDLESARRFTHVFELSDNDIRQREIDGRFCKPQSGGSTATPFYADKKDEGADKVNPQTNELTAETDRRQGVTAPPVSKVTPWTTGEQYCWWDLDGDGYEEPYIVTFQVNTGAIRRIVARFNPSGVKRWNGKQVYEITPIDVFVKYSFIPSPDGGFYDLGLGALLGPINESVNAAINQIFDAGTMSTLGGGFLGRGFKNRGGAFTFRPFEWYPVDAPGDDLRKNVMPLPVREPSNVLLQLAQWLIQYGERIASATEVQMGENVGQNTPAETMRTMNENGARVYTAIYKRTWRSLRDEYRIQYALNKYHLSQTENYQLLTQGRGAMIQPDDYKGSEVYVCPAADPYVASDTIRQQQAMQLVQMASQLPGFNRYQTQKRALKAMKVQDLEQVYPALPPQQGPNGQQVPATDFPPPPADPRMITAQATMMKAQTDQQEAQGELAEMRIKLMNEVIESRAKVQNLQAQAALYAAQAKSEYSEPLIKLIYAEIESEGVRADRMLRLLDTMSSHIKGQQEIALKKQELSNESGSDGGTGMGGMAAPSSNGAVLGALGAGISGNGAGMGGGSVPIQ